MSDAWVPCALCGRHVRSAEPHCPFCRASRSPALLGAVVSLAVSCGTPTTRPTTGAPPPPLVPDAIVVDAAPIEVAPPPDAASDAPPATGKGSIRGRVFRKTASGERIPYVSLNLTLGNRTIMQVGTNKQGAYEFVNLPPGTFTLRLHTEDWDADGRLEVIVGQDEAVKLDIDLTTIPLRPRPAKPYGAPPARRRVV